MAWDAAQDEEVRQDVDDVRGFQSSVDPDRQALSGELVNDVQHAELPAVVGTILDEVVGPDMVGPLGSKPHTGAVIQPEPPLLRLGLRHFEPLQTPDAFDPSGVHRPAGRLQQCRDPAVAIAAVLRGERDDVGGEGRIIGATLRRFSLGRAMLPQHAARRPLRHVELRPDVIDAAATAAGA